MRFVFVGFASVLAGLAVFEVTMQPRESERVELAVIFVTMALLMALAAIWLPRYSQRFPSLRVTFGVLSIASFAIVGVGVVAVAGRMFSSEHDVTLLLVVLGFGAVAAVGFALLVSKPMSDDLEQLAEAAKRVAGSQTQILPIPDRRDEVGALATAISQMVDRLDAAELRRVADEEARRSFFAAVGHDLRTPLASLRAAVEALQDGVAVDQDRYLDSMAREIGVLTSLVEDIYLLARIESGGIEPDFTAIDLTELADEAIEVVRPLADREAITLRLESNAPMMAVGGSAALGRVLRNLLDNAVRNSPPGSEVLVSVGSDGLPSVVVIDQGEGFSPDFLDSAFDRFSRGDPARTRHPGGSGLGLAIARGFVNALDGEIWAEPGPGGKVGFRLPS